MVRLTRKYGKTDSKIWEGLARKIRRIEKNVRKALNTEEEVPVFPFSLFLFYFERERVHSREWKYHRFFFWEREFIHIQENENIIERNMVLYTAVIF